MINRFDILVVGGGHAGCEAAHASAKLGKKTLLITNNTNEICKLSCNPAIGGLAKGQIVREIDALGGLMAKIADKTGIQFRMLNLSKGPAVWGPRAQVDKEDYMATASSWMKSLPDLTLLDTAITGLIIKNRKICGVTTAKGEELLSKTAILACGTFLDGLIHIGGKQIKGGRLGDPPGKGVSQSLLPYGVHSFRLKTGTPARIKKNSVDFSNLPEQKGDESPQPFSYSTGALTVDQVSCFLTRTTAATHSLIRKNFQFSPMAAGMIKSKGPRYCPSIETKLINFPEKDSHQLFIEPEGRNHPDIYLNGFSNCFPEEIQQALLKTIPGLAAAEISKPAYAIEYDCFPPVQLKSNLESKIIDGLFFAGQVNGTSGYEEAAAQGLIAGINAARKIAGRESFVLKRSEAYIGVLVDDLVTKGTEEPYRMFTSRAEFRLFLRQDNADERLLKKGREIGLVDQETFRMGQERIKRVYDGVEEFKKIRVDRTCINPYLKENKKPLLSENISLYQVLKRPEINVETLIRNLGLDLGRKFEEAKRIEIIIKYEGYLKKQGDFIREFEKTEEMALSPDMDYAHLRNLSTEAREKLGSIKPATIGQASRISGVSPADIQTLIIMRKYGPSRGEN
jgi:tRNA uridine 5-carboxymethylaminomethyl modification enzyme